MARITVEDCIDKFPSRFELVLVASHRARKLYSGETPAIEVDNDKNTVIALREIAENKLTFFDDNYAALENSNALVLMTEWKMFRNPSLSKMKELMENLCIFDGRNQYDPDYMRENGFEYKGIGR